MSETVVRKISISELAVDLSKVLSRTDELDEVYVILKYGKPMALLTPCPPTLKRELGFDEAEPPGKPLGLSGPDDIEGLSNVSSLDVYRR